MSHVVMATETGEQHGLINVIPNTVPDNEFKHMKPENKAKCEKIRKDEKRIVKARYINHRGMNERLSKPYMRWAGDAIEFYHLIPGHVYDLPYGFIKEVNDNPGMPQRSDMIVDGKPRVKDAPPIKIHELVPCSF